MKHCTKYEIKQKKNSFILAKKRKNLKKKIFYDGKWEKKLSKGWWRKNIKDILYYIKYRWSFLSEKNKLYFEFIYFKLRVFPSFCKTFRICGFFFFNNKYIFCLCDEKYDEFSERETFPRTFNSLVWQLA